MVKRFDIIAHDNLGKADLLVECKAPNVMINQKTFDQIITYNKVIKSKYLMVTNGIIHYYCMIDKVEKKIRFLKEIPNYR